MLNAAEFSEWFDSLRPKIDGATEADVAFLHMGRALVFLVREVVVAEGPSTGQKLRFANAVTRPEYLADPTKGAEAMEALAADPENGNMMVEYSCAADVFTDCWAAADSQLHRFFPILEPV